MEAGDRNAGREEPARNSPHFVDEGQHSLGRCPIAARNAPIRNREWCMGAGGLGRPAPAHGAISQNIEPDIQIVA